MKLSDLTIEQYLKCKLIADFEPDPFIRKLRLYAEFTGKTLEEVERIPINELSQVLRKFEVNDTLDSNAKVKMKFKLGGKKYIILWRQQDMTAEQYIDASHFCKDQTNIVHNIHNILASLAVERTWWKNKPYSGETHKERAELFKREMRIKDAYPIMVFFYTYFKKLDDNTLTFLEKEAAKVKEVLGKRFTQSGVGLQQSMT